MDTAAPYEGQCQTPAAPEKVSKTCQNVIKTPLKSAITVLVNLNQSKKSIHV